MKHNLIRSFLCMILAAALVLAAASVYAESGESHGGMAPGGSGSTPGAGLDDGSGSGGSGFSGGGMPQATEPPDDRYEVTKEYMWHDEDGYNYAMVIRNKSGAACSYIISLDFLDGFGEKVGGTPAGANTCDDGAEALVLAKCDTPFERVRYTIKVADPTYNDISTYVTATVEKTGDGAIVKVANTGTVDAEFVEYHCIFLDDSGKAVGTAWGFTVDGDSVLKSGKMEMRQVRCPVEFSSVEVYLKGHTDLDVVNTGTVEVQDSAGAGIEVIAEHSWDTTWGYSYHAVVFKNVSGEDAGVRATFTFYDAGGTILSVVTREQKVCAPGYEVCMEANMEGTFDHAECTLELQSTKYKDIHADIQYEATTDLYCTTITATNNGTKTAEGVEYIVLFLGADGKAVGSDWGYLSGEGSNSGALRPGETTSRDVWCGQEHAAVAVYITGYRKK